MNSLSWLLYFAGIAGPLSNALTNLAILGFVVIVIATIAGATLYGFASERSRYDSEDTKAAKDGVKASLRKALKQLPRWVVLPVIFSIVGAAIPPKETLYLIAASEVGETVVTSPTMTKAIDALNRLLDGVAVKKPAAP